MVCKEDRVLCCILDLEKKDQNRLLDRKTLLYNNIFRKDSASRM